MDPGDQGRSLSCWIRIHTWVTRTNAGPGWRDAQTTAAEPSVTWCRYGSRTSETGGGGPPIRMVVSFFAEPGDRVSQVEPDSTIWSIDRPSSRT